MDSVMKSICRNEKMINMEENVMKKSKKLIVLIVAVALIAAVGVGSTLAYLTSKSDTVTNTFTVGKYPDNALVIKEHAVTQNTDGDYVADTAEVTSNAYNDILPGVKLDKDPFLRLAANSPTSYLFMKASGLATLAANGVTVTTSNFSSVAGTGVYWLALATAPNGSALGDDTYYVYCPDGNGVPGVVTKTTSVTTTPALFTQLTASATTLATGDLNSLTFSGCAVQVTSDVTYDVAYSSAIFN